MAHSGIKREINEDFRDSNFYKEVGWFESDYYYPVKLNPLKVLIGKLSDKIKM